MSSASEILSSAEAAPQTAAGSQPARRLTPPSVEVKICPGRNLEPRGRSTHSKIWLEPGAQSPEPDVYSRIPISPGEPRQREDAADDGRRILRRVRRRLIPFAFICYVVAYIDRVNIGFAASELQRDLGLSSTEYGFGAGLFFLTYCLFEIPSNLILERVGARRWLARIMIGWGVVSMGTMFITDVRSFMAARALLGIAEAGFFPGMVLYLTYWIPATDRARTGALFMVAAPVAVIVGAPVSEALLQLDGALGLRGWQWLFLIEGLPAVVLGVLALRVLTDRPEVATWLAPEDRRLLPRITGLTPDERYALELEFVDRSIVYARNDLGLV